MVEDSAIESTLARTRDPQRCASMLVNEAIAAGGYDNVTVVVVDVAGQIDKVTRRYKRRSRLFMSFVILLLLAILGAAGFGVYAYIDASAYLIAENGTVSVYRGVPDELFGQPLSRLDHATDISVDDLQPGVASRLQTGIRVDGLEAANRLVDEYRAYIEQSAASETPEANRDDAGTANSSSSAATSSSEEQNNRAGGDAS